MSEKHDATPQEKPYTLAAGEAWVDLDAGNPKPSRASARTLKAELKEILTRDGHEVGNKISVQDSEHHRGLHVTADLAEAVQSAATQLHEKYPNIAVTQAEKAAEKPVDAPEVDESTKQPSSLKLKGGAALGSAAIGAVLMHKGKGSEKDGEGQQKQNKVLKAIGVVLAVAVPVALLGKELYDRSRGAQTGLAR